MEKPVLIFGAKNLTRSVLEIFESHQIVVYGILDSDSSLHGTEINGIPVLGDPDDRGFLKLIGQKCEAFVATDDQLLRKKQVEILIEERKTMPVNAIHSKAFLAKSAVLGHGNFINQQASIGSSVKIGNHCLIHSGAILEEGVTLGDFVQIGSGAIIGAGVHISEHAFIGAGAIIVAGVEIGAKSRVGIGSVVIQEIAKNTTVFGNPAQPVKK